MAPFVQLVRRCQPGRTAADHRHLFPGTYLRRSCRGIAFFVGLLDNGIFVLFRGYRIPVQPAGAGIFAQSRTDSGSEFRKIVCLFQSVIGLFPVACVDKVIPLRHKVVEWTAAGHTSQHHAGLTERNAAFHTPRSLKSLFALRKMCVEFVKMFHSRLRRFCLRYFSLIVYKSCWFSHRSSRLTFSY